MTSWRLGTRGMMVCAALSTCLGCSSGADAPSDDPDADGSSRTFSSYEEGRYCEVLIATPAEGADIVADVWNSLPFGSCPQPAWDALDEATVRADFPDALLVLLNGPRFFLMQEIVDNGPAATPETHVFGEIDMVLAATVTVDPAASGRYVERTVDRTTTFRWESGHQVFELLASSGELYVMQSFSRIEDPDLMFEDLATLDQRLTLPEGWTYRVRTLEADLDVIADGTATVIQDDLSNTYQRHDAPVQN